MIFFILHIFQQKFDVPEDFKISVTSELRRLVLTGELEKVSYSLFYQFIPVLLFRLSYPCLVICTFKT